MDADIAHFFFFLFSALALSFFFYTLSLTDSHLKLELRSRCSPFNPTTTQKKQQQQRLRQRQRHYHHHHRHIAPFLTLLVVLLSFFLFLRLLFSSQHMALNPTNKKKKWENGRPKKQQQHLTNGSSLHHLFVLLLSLNRMTILQINPIPLFDTPHCFVFVTGALVLTLFLFFCCCIELNSKPNTQVLFINAKQQDAVLLSIFFSLLLFSPSSFLLHSLLFQFLSLSPPPTTRPQSYFLAVNEVIEWNTNLWCKFRGGLIVFCMGEWWFSFLSPNQRTRVSWGLISWR